MEEIKGLDACKNLNVLSLGRNRISDLKQINYLRKFNNLRCVCLDGNKICNLDNYEQHTLAYLGTTTGPDGKTTRQGLKYLDYMLVDAKKVAQVVESYQLDELTELKEQEVDEAARTKQAAADKAVAAKLQNSFLDVT